MHPTPLIGPAQPPQLHLMSFNIRRRILHLNRRSPDRWALREPLVKRLLASEQPTLLGVQEVMPDQAESVGEGLGEQYRWVGRGRKPDGSGEQCLIFYDFHRLDLLDWNQQSLSDTPDVPGSATWGNRNPRVVVSAVLRDKITGGEVLALNTHLDHISRKSRLHSVEMIRKLVSAAGRPALVLGDFNTGVSSKPYRNLVDDAMLHDSWLVARERVTEPWGTFPHYRKPRLRRKRIDWILTDSSFDVLSAGINVTRYAGVWPSDHAPVQAMVRLSAAAR